MKKYFRVDNFRKKIHEEIFSCCAYLTLQTFLLRVQS